jgi:CheY-like chemotaxis protein
MSEIGKGSTFTIRLPVSLAPPTIPMIAEIFPPDEFYRNAHHLIRVLVVDDNETNMGLTVDYLKAKDIVAVGVTDGELVLGELHRFQPHIILMDVQMPGLDGLELTRLIRASEDRITAEVFIIGLTDLAMPEDRSICLNAGMNNYFTKPISLKRLHQIIVDVFRTLKV